MRAAIGWCVPIFLLLVMAPALPATAGVTVDVDPGTLNRILAAVAVSEVEVPLGSERSVTVELRDLRVTGLAPASKNGERDAILTSLTVVAPELGIEVPLAPRVAVDVIRQGETSLLELRFEDLAVNLGWLGRINLAPFVPPMRYPTDSVWLIAGERGDVPVTSHLTGIEMARDKIRFELHLEVAEQP